MTYPLQWTLSALGPEPGTPAFVDWLNAIKTSCGTFRQAIAPALAAPDTVTPAALRQLVDQYGHARCEYHQALSLVECYVAAEAGNEAYRFAHGALSALQPVLEKTEQEFDQLLTRVDSAQLAAWLNDPALADIREFLLRRQQAAAIRLPDELAEFAAELNVNGLSAWSRLYDLISGKLRIPLMERGQIVEKSPGQIAFDSPDRSERENSFFASQSAWNSVADTAAAIMNHLVGSRLTINRFAGRKDHLVVPMLQNRVTPRAVEVMWSAIEQFKPRIVDYLLAKQRLLGLDEFCWYDVDAPVVRDSSRINYPTACQTILRAFGEFHPPLQEFARVALTEHWVEAEDRGGKRQGAFCTDFPSTGQTRVFMTFRNTEDALSTLAHELGHAYHSWILRNQPYVSQSYPMSLAETASTFAETIVAEQRLRTVTDPAGQLATLDRLLGDAAVFMMNIHCRWIFDNAVHLRRAEGELTAADFSEMMVSAQKTAFCDLFAPDGYNPTFWISKLHFYMADEPFYNFPYTFGYLLSQRLYREAQQDPQGFPARYDAFLSRTTAASALVAAQESFGFDFESPTFWAEALQPIEERIATYLELAKTR